MHVADGNDQCVVRNGRARRWCQRLLAACKEASQRPDPCVHETDVRRWRVESVFLPPDDPARGMSRLPDSAPSPGRFAGDAIVAEIHSPQTAQPERDLFAIHASSFVNALTAAPSGGLLDAPDHPYCAIATMFFGCFVSFFVCVIIPVLCHSFLMMFLRHITTQMRRTASETYCCVLALSLSIIGECKRGSVRAVTP